MDLKANTAVDVLIGPFVDKTDGNTTEDGLTLTAAEIKLSKNGQALTLKSDVTSAAFDDDGYYNCELDATDTNTEGNLVLIVHQAANALPVRHEYNVLSEAAWDSQYLAKDTGFMDVNIKEFGDDAQSMTDLKDFADAGYNPATNKVAGVLLVDVTTTNTDMVAEAPTDVATGTKQDTMETTLGALTAAGPTKTEMDTAHGLLATEAKQDIIDTNVDQIETAVITNAAGADIAADIIAVKAETVLIVADTNELQGDDVPGLIAALNNITVADILTTAITEAYATQGAAPTLAQFISMSIARQGLTKSAIVDTTWTLYKLDGTTIAMTITLDSATIPAILTRAT